MTTPTTVNIRLQLRADTAANWTAANPILLANEVGLETDTKKLKVGDGSTAWTSLAYFPSIVTGGTVLGNLEIGSTGTLTFEGSTADGFETTLAVTDPTADRTITLPNQSGTVVVSGNASIVDADIAANAEIAVSKLANGTANQVLVTDGTDVSWSDDLTLAGNLTVNGTTTTVNTQTLVVEDKNIELGVVGTPTDLTADGGGITLKGATDKTINWVDATDAWTSSERFSVPLGSAASPSLTFTGDENTGIYSPGADQLALSTNGTKRIEIQADGDIDIDGGGVFYDATNNRLAIGTTSPAQLLHISGSSGYTILQVSDSSVNSYFYSSTTVGAGWVGTQSNHPFVIGTNNTERCRVDTSGRLLVGTSSAYSITNTHPATLTPYLQVSGADENRSTALLTYWANGASGSRTPSLALAKSDGAEGVYTAVAGEDKLGEVSFHGADGSAFKMAAAIHAKVDGTPGANDMPGRLVFLTTADGASSPTERMRITNDGKLYFACTADPSSTIKGGAYIGSAASPYFSSSAGTSTSTYTHFYFINGNGTVGSISTSGSTTSYNTSSDYRLKENVTPVTDGITRLQQLKPSRFNFIADPDKTVDGFLAHEVQSVVPEAITGEKDAVDDDGKPVYQGIDQSKLVPLLTAALQEAIGEIESLKARVAALETP